MWNITDDFISELDGSNRVGYGTGRVGPITPNSVRFHLYDDDRNLYYSGYLTDDSDWEKALSFGMLDAGCTIIRDGRGQDVIS